VRFCPIKQNSSSQLRRGLRGLIDCQKFALSVGLRSRNPTPATVSLGYAVALAFAQRVLCTQPCPEGFTHLRQNEGSESFVSQPGSGGRLIQIWHGLAMA